LGAFITAFSSPVVAGEPTAEPAASTNRVCASYAGIPEGEGDHAGMVFIPGGSFVMGSDQERPEERFSHTVKVDGFSIDQHEVTNAQFAKFVDATGYKTLAERGVDPKTHPTMSGDLLSPGSMLPIAGPRCGGTVAVEGHQRRLLSLRLELLLPLSRDGAAATGSRLKCRPYRFSDHTERAAIVNS
jgi:formylglycine-generating enzyme required for sulfatase activity